MGLPNLSPSYFVRIRLLVGAVAVIVCGLCLRAFGYDVGLSFVAVKYGGSVLWGAMVYLLLAAVFPARWHGHEVHVAILVVVVVELIRLIHFPALDAFRATTTGALLLGRVFSLWNIICYLGGIGAASLIAGRVWRASPSSSP
ncbi:ribosomal maturation YjgA family protein [Rhizobium sp. GR12]|uniref:ribosomal maturation YjgA family protein n=1 Tax=Rhizobium sp. GR12 TaxID=3053925 RepID=UPI002FBDDD2E